MQMKRVLVPHLPKPGNPVELPVDESHHVISVLRLSSDDRVEVLDGGGSAITARLEIRKKMAWVHLLEEGTEPRKASRLETVPVCLELAMIKGEAMEWAIEKAVELGIEKLVPLQTAHTVVQIHRKGTEAFRERWQKIADQALKQCGRLTRMEVAPPIELELLLSQQPSQAERPRIWCSEMDRETTEGIPEFLDRNPRCSSLNILIGPEGGWSEMERNLLQSSLPSVQLGPLILRAETAVVVTGTLAGAHFRARKLDKSG